MGVKQDGHEIRISAAIVEETDCRSDFLETSSKAFDGTEGPTRLWLAYQPKEGSLQSYLQSDFAWLFDFTHHVDFIF
jgi:hypothetical protein